MSTKDPEQIKQAAHIERLEKVVRQLLIRVATLERESKLLRGRVGRATDRVGQLDQKVSRAK